MKRINKNDFNVKKIEMPIGVTNLGDVFKSFGIFLENLTTYKAELKTRIEYNCFLYEKTIRY